jgi:hypothetical protein
MTEWRNLHLHYTELDRILLDVVAPFLESVAGRLERRYWERGHAGGPHLRVCLRAPRRELDEIVPHLRRRAEDYFRERPAAPLAVYSEDRAASMVLQDGDHLEGVDLTYRNNQVVEPPYPSRRHPYVSTEAETLAQDFRHDSHPLAIEVLRGAIPKREQMLRLFLVHAAHLTRGDIVRGSVSFKSHWEGFAATFGHEEVLERIGHTYEANRTSIRRLLQEVLSVETDGEPLRGAWESLMDSYRVRANGILRAGGQITPQPSTLEEARRVREDALGAMRRGSAFVERLWADEHFIASIQYEPRFLVPRVLTNLLYVLHASIGLSVLDKMALCHFAFRSVEEHYDCNLDDVLVENIARISSAHRHHWEN